MSRPTIAPTPPAPVALTPDEAKMLVVFRAMDCRAKSDVIEFATRLAELNPHRAVPSLRLIAGGAQ